MFCVAFTSSYILVIYPCYQFRVDGEAMIHAVKFEDGKAKSYANHWLRCARFVDEHAAGQNIYLRVRLSY
jgi:carotenoid cleavage dioxygenase-like enzyme